VPRPQKLSQIIFSDKMSEPEGGVGSLSWMGKSMT